MSPTNNTQGPDKLSVIVSETETKNIVPLEQRIIDLSERELDDLSERFRASQMQLQEKERAQVVIQNQKERLRLKTQLPQRPAVAGTVPTPEQKAAPTGSIIHRFSVGVTNTLLPSKWTKDWSEDKKGWVGAGMTLGMTVVAGLAIRSWLRSRKAVKDGVAAGSEAKGGFFKKLMIGLGVGGAALVGLDLINKKLKNPLGLPTNLLPDISIPTGAVTGGTDIVTGATSELAKTGGKALETGSKNAAFILELMRKDNVGEALNYAMQNGAALAYEDLKFMLHIGTQAIALPMTMTGKIKDWIATGKRDENFFVLWGATGAAYFVGEKTFNLLMRGQITTLIPLTKKDLALTALKIASGPLAPARDALTLAATAGTSQGREALRLRYIKQSSPGQIGYAIGDGISVLRTGSLNTEAGMLRAVEEWKILQRDKEIMEMFDTGLFRMFSDTEVKSAIRAETNFADSIRKALGKMQINQTTTPLLIQELAKESGLGTEEFIRKMDEIHNKHFVAPTGTPTPNPTTSAGSGTPHPNPNTQPHTGSQPHPTSQPHTNPNPTQQTTQPNPNTTSQTNQPTKTPADTLLEDAKIAAALKDAEDAQEMQRVLNTLDPETAELIQKSRKAKKLLMGAITSGKTIEMERIVSAANRARTLRLSTAAAWNGVGVLGDVFGLYMAYCDWEKNKDRIVETDNPALKDLYASANLVYAIEGGSSAVGLAIGGVAIYQAYAAGSGILMALGAPAGMIMLPIGAAVAAGRITYNGLEQSTEYHTLNERDLQKKFTPGQLLEHIAQTTELENLNWQQDFFLNKTAARLANETARNDAYRAYFAQIAAITLPSVTTLDLDNEAGMTTEQKQQALNTLQSDRLSAFIRDAEQYIAYKTNNTFELVDATALREASIHAMIQYEKRDTQSADAPSVETADWKQKEEDVKNRKQETNRLIAASLAAASKDPVLFEHQLPDMILPLIHDDIAICEEGLLTANFSVGGDWSSAEQIRSVARGKYAEDMWTVLHEAARKVQTSGEPLEAGDIEKIISDLKKILQYRQSSMAESVRMYEPDRLSYYEKLGASSSCLSVFGMQELIRNYTLAKPTVLSSTKERAFSTKSIEYYSADQMKQGMPVILQLAPGKDKGFLRIDESMWMSTDDNKKYEQVGTYEYLKTIKLTAGHDYKFWRESKMKKLSGTEKLDGTYDVETSERADMDIIVQEATEPVVEKAPTSPSESTQDYKNGTAA